MNDFDDDNILPLTDPVTEPEPTRNVSQSAGNTPATVCSNAETAANAACSLEVAEMPFEQALEKLEALVARMESGNLPLEDLMTQFEQGSRLAAVCRAKLEVLERKIELLTRDDGKEGVWNDFEADAAAPSRNAPGPDAAF